MSKWAKPMAGARHCAELIRLDGAYARLFNLQAEGYR
jgi:hypothetical protein